MVWKSNLRVGINYLGDGEKHRFSPVLGAYHLRAALSHTALESMGRVSYGYCGSQTHREMILNQIPWGLGGRIRLLILLVKNKLFPFLIKAKFPRFSIFSIKLKSKPVHGLPFVLFCTKQLD